MRRLLRRTFRERLLVVAVVLLVSGALVGHLFGALVGGPGSLALVLWLGLEVWSGFREQLAVRSRGAVVAEYSRWVSMLVLGGVVIIAAGWEHSTPRIVAVGLVVGAGSLALERYLDRRRARRAMRAEQDAWLEEMRTATPVRLVGPGDPHYRPSEPGPVPVKLRVLGPGAVTAPVGRCGEWPAGEVVVDSWGGIVSAPDDESAHPGGFAQCYKPAGHEGLHTWQLDRATV